eukprot:TRINITY_DN19924_c0_g1_i1.p1 TRINITY_DN19924_c0_g1~~TRINITY_DN19924_c0_g1_i1.p1  ORF type:complete len:577 (+),score=93.68 TRINITY_DN19924_c0_g1_i1:233-1963(+)
MPPPAKKARTDRVVQWEWKNDSGAWVAYDPKDCAVLEAGYQTGRRTLDTSDFTFNKGHGTIYTIDFKAMTQQNTSTSATRAVRRIDPPSDDDDDADRPRKTSSGAGLWEWFNDECKWAPYDPKDCSLLEDAYKGGTKLLTTTDLTFNKGYGSLYIFDFKVMTQVNTDSGTSRKIRRKRSATATKDDSSDDETGFASSFTTTTSSSTAVVTAPSASPASPSPLTPSGSVKKSTTSGPSITLPPPLDAAEIKRQAALGAQSKRSVKSLDYGPVVSKDAHGRHCFDKMLENESRLCGEWAVFYHSYSAAALMYEVQAAVASVLFRFKSAFATLPRILTADYEKIPDAATLLKEFKKMKSKDHDPRFRSVGICGTSALLADDSEAPAKSVFLMGYSVGPLTGVLENLLKRCGVPAKHITDLTKKIVGLAVEHGLDARAHGGAACKSGRSGHMLQIFVKREIVDQFVYPSFPYGVPDPKRDPLSDFLAGKGPIAGQVRIVCHPAVWMRATYVRMFVYSADPTFHSRREAFQDKLTKLLHPILGSDDTRYEAAKGIFNGNLPSWWASSDQSGIAKTVHNAHK